MNFRSAEAMELYYAATTDGDNYRQFLRPAYVSLERHHRRGRYDRDRAVTLIEKHTLASIAKRYVQSHCSSDTVWHRLFTPADRLEVAGLIVDHHLAEMEIGNYHE